jgi:hypothetical protein
VVTRTSSPGWPAVVAKIDDVPVACPIGQSTPGTHECGLAEPDGEGIISRYALRELLDKLDELTALPGTTQR